MLKQIKTTLHTKIPASVIGATAQFALVIVIGLRLVKLPNSYFLQGALTGFAIVGNIFWLSKISKS